MNYVIVDIERNVFNYKTDRIEEVVEIGAVKMNEKGEFLSHFSKLVRPRQRITSFTKKLTGITNEMVKREKSFSKVWKSFLEFAGDDYIFVSWGKEDMKFLEHDCVLHNLPLPCPKESIDLQEVVMFAYEGFYPDTPGLARVSSYFSIEWTGNQHRAYEDALQTAKIFKIVQKEKDVHHIEYSHPERIARNLFFHEGELNQNGKKRMESWIYRLLQKEKVEHLSWKTFSIHPLWDKKIKEFQIEEEEQIIFKNHFLGCLHKAQERYTRVQSSVSS